MSCRHLTDVENRLQKLENVFALLLPDVDIESVLSSPSLPQLPMQLSESNAPSAATAQRRTDSALEDELSEALPQEADGFEWKEEATEAHNMADGKAALSVEPSGIGYLGEL